jgi:hypothetical protein
MVAHRERLIKLLPQIHILGGGLLRLHHGGDGDYDGGVGGATMGDFSGHFPLKSGGYASVLWFPYLQPPALELAYGDTL